MTPKHLIFYDGTCGLCHRTIQFLLRHDTQKIFLFAPLQGEAAKVILKDWRSSHFDADTVVLVENYQDLDRKQILAYGKGAFRICWLMGGFWSIPGLLSFLPGVFYNWGYRYVASRRFGWFEREECLIPTKEDQSRFLP